MTEGLARKWWGPSGDCVEVSLVPGEQEWERETGERRPRGVPPQDNWWACSTGLAPCVHGRVLNNSKDFCILVLLVPRLFYHSNDEILPKIEASHRSKREPVSALTLTVLLWLGASGAELGHSL